MEIKDQKKRLFKVEEKNNKSEKRERRVRKFLSNQVRNNKEKL